MRKLRKCQDKNSMHQQTGTNQATSQYTFGVLLNTPSQSN